MLIWEGLLPSSIRLLPSVRQWLGQVQGHLLVNSGS